MGSFLAVTLSGIWEQRLPAVPTATKATGRVEYRTDQIPRLWSAKGWTDRQ